MAPVTGTAEFRHDEKSGKITHVAIEAVVQPHSPEVHDILQLVAESRQGGVLPVSITHENGNLKMSTCVAVPEFARDPETNRLATVVEIEEKRRLAEAAAAKAAQDLKDAAAAAAAEQKLRDEAVVETLANRVADRMAERIKELVAATIAEAKGSKS